MSLPDLPPVLHLDVSQPGVQVAVDAPAVEVETSLPPVVVAVAPGPPGPAGPQGVPGDGGSGAAWFTGVGPPGTIVGSSPGDYYIDTSTGTIYRLGD